MNYQPAHGSKCFARCLISIERVFRQISYCCQKERKHDFSVGHIFHLLSHPIFSSIHLLYVKRQTPSKQEFWKLFRNRLVAVYQGLSEQSQPYFF